MLRIFCSALACLLSVPGFAADTISATHVFPASLIYSRSFLEFVKKANEAGKGEFTIQVRGGPEAIGMMEQPGAVRSGVVDMVYSPCAFYAAVVPECDAVSASTVDGPTARRNGGIDLLNQIHQKRMGVVLLGWVDSGIRFTLWSTKEPKFDGSGHIDIKGFKVRGNPIYNAFLTNYLGAQVININSSELYTALERGTVDITAWTQIGLMDLNWDRYIKYRILPDFFETDLMIIMNQKKWSSLSPKTREILQRTAIEHESASLQSLQDLWKKEQAELGQLLHVHRVRASRRALPRRALAGAREGTHLRRDPADVSEAPATQAPHLRHRRGVHRGLRNPRLVRLRSHDQRLPAEREGRALARHAALDSGRLHPVVVRDDGHRVPALQIGRASCRERV